MENWFDKNKFFEKLLIFTWIIFLFFCLFLISFTSKAATLDEFDQYYPMHQNQDANGTSYYTTAILDYIDNYFDSENNYIFSFYSNPHNGQKCFYVYVLSKQATGIFGELKTDITNFSLYNIGPGHSSHAYGLIISDDGSGPYVWSSNDSMFQNLGYSYCVASNFILYTNNNPETRRILLLWGDVEEDPDGTPGHATHPHFDGLHPHYGNTVNPPSEVPPSYTINNYSWTTYNSPSIDTSSVESLLESLIYVINYLAGWLSSNISGEFSNLLDNLECFFSYIGETLQYYGDLIIDNIQNGIQNFYDNMVSLVEPIFEKLDYISEPVDGSIIYDNISSTSLITNISTINTALSSFQSSFDSLSEPNSFTIPIHLENLPSAYFGVQTTQYIDLGVLGSTEKGIIRTFMWALITYSLFITIVDSISNYINGGGDES